MRPKTRGIGMSRSRRDTASVLPCSRRLKSWAIIFWTACLMTGAIWMMEMTPAAKMPPMPMFLTPSSLSLKICS